MLPDPIWKDRNTNAYEIRLFFIYSSFITLGSPVIIYVSLAMMMKIRTYLRKMNNPILFD